MPRRHPPPPQRCRQLAFQIAALASVPALASEPTPPTWTVAAITDDTVTPPMTLRGAFPPTALPSLQGDLGACAASDGGNLSLWAITKRATDVRCRRTADGGPREDLVVLRLGNHLDPTLHEPGAEEEACQSNSVPSWGVVVAQPPAAIEGCAAQLLDPPQEPTREREEPTG